MEAVLVREIGDFELVETPVPRPGRGEALIEVSVTGLCRTDLKLIEVGHRDLELPRVPGEEVVGVVREVCPGAEDQDRALGAGADPASFAVGERVYVYPGISCGGCRPCLRGAGNLCRDMRIMGFHRDGGFAEHVVAPLRSLIRVPHGLADEAAVFAEPLSCCLNALELGRVGDGDVLGVWGAGPAGTLLSRAAVLRGAEVIVTEPDERRRERVETWAAGPAWAVRATVVPPPDGSLDAAIVAVGSSHAYEEALAALGPRGRLVVFSGLSPSADAAAAPSLDRLHYNEQTVVGAYGCAFRHGVEALDLLASDTLPVTDLISHRLPLSDLHRGLEIVAQRSGMKVHLYPRGRTAAVAS
ncbi:MAG: alcohol dehydrogenase catalytic domain-containing protein [Actinobacteria bacterium]|nr:alcohol dehydrogenase catalytic domain-containing protein [Actinomycetota bacterium]